jgi:hypothetical protein
METLANCRSARSVGQPFAALSPFFKDGGDEVAI